MLPTTKETNKRMKTLLDLTYPNTLTNTSSYHEEDTPDIFHSFENTFSSSEFHNMYTKTSQDNTKTESLSYLWTYPFENELSKTVERSIENISNGSNAYICLYRICKGVNGLPFLQYKLQLANANSKKKQPRLVFPSIPISASSSKDISSVIKRADDYVANTIHCERFEYKGMVHEQDVASQSKPVYSGMGGKRKAINSDNDGDDNNDDKDDVYSSDSSSDDDSESESNYTIEPGEPGEPGETKESRGGERSVYLFYYDTLSENSSPVSITSKTEWYWSCIHEMFNSRSVLQYRVGRSVSALFVHHPTALFLVNNKGVIYETPHVLYKGLPHGVSINEMCKFGPRIHIDDNNVSFERKKHLMKKNINEVSIHGSYYYFYDYCDAVRGACYTYDDETNTYKKNESDECYLFRYVVFLGRLKVLMFDKMNGTTNHVPLRGACMTRETNWPLSGYDSMYHGKYTLMHDRHQNHKNLYPAFSVCDPHTFSGLTYHKVNMTSVSVDIEEMFKRKKYLKLK